MVQKFDLRQSVSRDFLDQLTLNSDYIAAIVGGKDANSTEADNLMRSINDELTVPLRMSASNTPDLVITLDGAQITNSETGRGRSLPPIDGVVPSFAGGTITFPATDAGNITPSVGTAIAVTTTAGNFNKLGVFLNSAGEIVLVEGTEGATIAAAVAPGEEPGMLYVGYIQFGVDGGGNITGSDTTPAVLPNTDVFQLPILGSGISAIVNQDRGIKLLGGGNWSVTGAGSATDFDNGVTVDQLTISLDGANRAVSQSFIATGTALTSVSVENFARGSIVGSGPVEAQLWTDNGSDEPDVLIATSTNTRDAELFDPTGLPGAYTPQVFSFASVPITPATKYVIAFRMVAPVTSVGTWNVFTNGAGSDTLAGVGFAYDLGGGFTAQVNHDMQMTTTELVGGGNPVLTWDTDAYIQVPGMANDRNTIPAGTTGTMTTDQVAYVEINRVDPGIATDISGTLTVVDVDAFVPSDNRLIIARENDGAIIVGDDSFRVIVGESQTLEASASNETLALLGSGVTEATSTPTYSTRTPAAPQRTLDDTQPMLEAMSSIDTEIDKFFGQLRLQPHATDVDRATITGVDFTMKDNSVLSQEIASLVMEFDGAIINFTTGEVRSADDLSSLGVLFTPAALAVNEYRWYSIALVANTQDVVTEAMEATFVILPGSSDNLVAADAPYAPFGGSKKVGQVQVQNVAGTITVGAIRQLGVGAGGGGNDQDRNLKLIEGGTWSVTQSGTDYGTVIGPEDIGGTDFQVRVFESIGTDLYVGGSFTNVDGIAIDRIAKYDTVGDVWTDIGGADGAVEAFAVIGTDLYVGGFFNNVNTSGVPVAANRIAVYDTVGGTWADIGGLNFGAAESLVAIGTDLYVGGTFANVGTPSVPANNVAKYDTVGGVWTDIGGTDNSVLALHAIGTDLYVGGDFFNVNTSGVPFFSFTSAKYDTVGATWSNMGAGGATGQVRAFGSIGTDLYVGGNFGSVDGGVVPAIDIAVYDSVGDSWAAIGGGTNNRVHAIETVGTDVFIVGNFTTVDGGAVAASRIARYDTLTTTWTEHFTGGLGEAADALQIIDDYLYVGGFFLTMGAIPSANIGRWQFGIGDPSLTWDADAYIQVPGVSNTRNTLPATAGLAIADGSVAFVEINRLAGAVDTPAITVDTIENVNQYSADLLIFARGVSDGIIVGNNSFLLKVGESLELEGALAEINRYHDQFRIRTTSNTNEVSVESADTTMLDGTFLRQELNGFVVDFTGATIDFTAGTSTINATGLSPIGTAIPAVGEYQWFGIGLLPDTVGVDGKMTPQFVITPAASSNAVQADAPHPVVSGDKKIGAVLLQNVGGTDALVVEVSRFSVGASGGASGDANSIIETLKNQLNCSFYDAVTANVFSVDEEAKLDTGASTGEYSLVTNNFEMDAAETMVSAQMLDTQFLATPSLLAEVDLSVFWDLATIDTGATYEVSRDGVEYQAITMTRHGETEVYTGNHVFTEEADTQSQAADAVTNGTFEMDATDEYVSQLFTLDSASVIKDIDLTAVVNGAPVGELYVAIYTDNAGDPDTLVSESVATDISTIAAGPITLDIPDTALAAGTYHFVLRTSTAYKTAYVAAATSIEFNTNTGAATPLQSSPDGTTWTPEGEGFTYDLQGSVMDLRVRITASATTQLQGYGILYEPTTSGTTATGVKNRESFFFNASDNLNEFTLTTFTPDADLLSVYLVETGQVFKIGAFTLDGRTIRFPVNTFDNGGTPTPYTLIADQTIGNSFDNSDLNGLLLTGNHLGSTDALVDKSLPGRGIFLRRPDGTLRELTIDDADNIVIYSV